MPEVFALYKNTERTNLVAIGDSALYNNGIGATSASHSINNTAIGSKALFSTTTGSRNTGIGYEALYSDTTALSNTAIGDVALRNNVSGNFNTAIGAISLYENNSGDNNVAIGYVASRRNTSGYANISIGSWANYYNQEGYRNTIIGYEAGKGTSHHDKSGSVFIGYKAGYYDTTDNKLYIENSNSNEPLIYGEFDNDIAAINGKLGVGTMDPSILFHVDGGTDASLSGGGYILSGDPTGQNIVMDENEIMARNNGAVNTLHLQRDGGNLIVHYDEDDIKEFAIKTDGKTGIGLNTPTTKLHIYTDTGEDGFRVQNSQDEVTEFIVKNDGKTGIGEGAPLAKLHIDTETGEDGLLLRIDGTTKLKVGSNGSITNWNAGSPTYAFQLQNSSTDLFGKGRAYAWTTYSDSRIKSDQKELQYGLKEVMQLQPKAYLHHSSETTEDGTFTMKSDQTSSDIGFIAQEVQKVIPEVVYQPKHETNDLWSMDYDRLVPVLTKAIQEQQEQIEELREKIEELEARLED